MIYLWNSLPQDGSPASKWRGCLRMGMGQMDKEKSTQPPGLRNRVHLHSRCKQVQISGCLVCPLKLLLLGASEAVPLFAPSPQLSITVHRLPLNTKSPLVLFFLSILCRLLLIMEVPLAPFSLLPLHSLHWRTNCGFFECGLEKSKNSSHCLSLSAPRAYSSSFTWFVPGAK